MALTTAQKAQQLAAVGYNGPTDTASVEAAYARTATPSDAAANPPSSPGVTNTSTTRSTASSNVTGQGIYQTSNGARSVAEMANELAGVGYNGPTDAASVLSAYARTTGGAVTDSTQQTQQPGVQQQDLTKTVNDALQPLVSAFQQGSGFSVQQLQETKREFDANLQLAQDQMNKIGIPQLVINQRVADAQIQFQTVASKIAEAQVTGVYNGQQTFQAKEQAIQDAFAQAGLTGTFNGQPTEAARQFNANLGLSYLTQASQFAASNPFQLSNFLRGSGATNGVPQYLQNLQNGVAVGATGNPNGATPAGALRLGDLQAGMGGGTTGFAGTDAAQQAINGIYGKGPNALATGTLESLSPDELTNLQQGINNGFGSAAGPAFLNAYKANPVRSQSAVTTTALA